MANSNAKIKSVQKSAMNDSLALSDELGLIKKQNQSCSTIVAPFRFSTENIIKAGGKVPPLKLSMFIALFYVVLRSFCRQPSTGLLYQKLHPLREGD